VGIDRDQPGGLPLVLKSWSRRDTAFYAGTSACACDVQ
jgi:hypothetical protein